MGQFKGVDPQLALDKIKAKRPGLRNHYHLIDLAILYAAFSAGSWLIKN